MGCFWAREDGGLLRRRDGGCAVLVGLGVHVWCLTGEFERERGAGDRLLNSVVMIERVCGTCQWMGAMGADSRRA